MKDHPYQIGYDTQAQEALTTDPVSKCHCGQHDVAGWGWVTTDGPNGKIYHCFDHCEVYLTEPWCEYHGAALPCTDCAMDDDDECAF